MIKFLLGKKWVVCLFKILHYINGFIYSPTKFNLMDDVCDRVNKLSSNISGKIDQSEELELNQIIKDLRSIKNHYFILKSIHDKLISHLNKKFKHKEDNTISRSTNLSIEEFLESDEFRLIESELDS